MQEEWRTTYLSEDHEVSNLGNVRTWLIRRTRQRADEPTLMKPQPNKDGHYTIWIPSARKRVFVHTLVLSAFVGLRPEGKMCRHLDGNPGNNVLTNLVWGTDEENKADARRHGTMPLGENHSSAKLTAANVDEIRVSSETTGVLARRYGVTDSMISNIKLGRSWKDRIGVSIETRAAVERNRRDRKVHWKLRQLT